MLVEPAKPHDIKGMCRAINRLSGGRIEERASELDSAVTSAVNSIVDSALDSVVGHFDSAITSAVSDAISGLSNATSAVQSGLDSAVSDLGSKITVVSDQASANSVAINSVESTLSSVIASVETELSDATSEVKVSAVSELASTAKVLSDATSAVQSGVDSVETISSDAYSLASDTRSLVDANEALLDSFNGIFIETMDFTISEAAGTVMGSLEQDGGGDLGQRFSDGYTTLDCTPVKTINLTAYVGTDAVPKEVFVYILQSAKTTLVASNSDWPAAEHIKIANLVLRSAAATGTDDGALGNRNWNDSTQGLNSQGHITHIEKRLRQEPTQYDNGIALTLKNSAGAALTTGNSSTAVEIVTSIGSVYQLHKHTFPAFDMYTEATDDVHVANQPTDEGGAYETTAALVTDITHYTDGTAAGVAIGVNKYFNLVVWGIQNRSGEASHVMINLPTSQYNNEADAIADVDGTSVYDIPSVLKGLGFLIARLTFRLVAGAQWTYIAQEDLRGQFPNVSAGVGIKTTDHGLLAGLSDDDHTQYALGSALVSVTGVLSDATSGVQSGLDSAVSDINSNIAVVSDTLSAVSNLAQSNATAIASVETLASDTLVSLQAYESALSDATSEVKASAASELTSAISNLQSSLSNTISEVKTSAASELTSTAKVLSDATSTVQSGVDSIETLTSTHKADDGSDHSFIDQDVKTSALPTFAGGTYNSKLTVNRNNNTTGDTLHLSNLDTGNAAGSIFSMSAEGNSFFIKTYGDSHASKANLVEVGSAASGTEMSLITEGTERMRIASGLTTIYQELNISWGLIGLVIGADSGAKTRTDATVKWGRFASAHYTNAEQPAAILLVESNVAQNNLRFGGGSSAVNAATQIDFYTAANNITVTGTSRMTIKSDGKVGIGMRFPKTKLTIEGALTLKEQAAADGSTAEYGQLWVKNTTPCELWFTDDAGLDTKIV